MCFVRQERFKRGVACADSDLLVKSCGHVEVGLGRSWAVLGLLQTGFCQPVVPCLSRAYPARREKRNFAEVPDVT